MLLVCRFPETIAGIAAGAAGDWELAEKHFEKALKQAEEFPHRVEEAEVQRFYAMMLIARTARGARSRARALLNHALESYERIGMPGHAGLTRTLLDQIR
jgi:tetratricopeptide (TPR) repeat protein